MVENANERKLVEQGNIVIFLQIAPTVGRVFILKESIVTYNISEAKLA
jgi:hypothetical protein